MKPFFSAFERSASSRRGFTLVEVLLSSVLLLVIVLMVVGMINAASKTYRSMNGQVSVFQDSAVVFDNVTRNVSEATLKTYLDYYPDQSVASAAATPPGPPQKYERNSDLHFVCGQPKLLWNSSNFSGNSSATLPEGITVSPSHAVFFQSPLDYTQTTPSTTPDADHPDYNNTSGLLAGCGYYVVYGKNQSFDIPGFTSNIKQRFRLMRLFVPTESLETYNTLRSTWFGDAVQAVDPNSKTTRPRYVRPIADNVVGFFIQPKATAADQAAITGRRTLTALGDYGYDTRAGLDTKTGKLMSTQPDQQHQLPSLVHMTMVVIDEPSAIRLANLSSDQLTEKMFDSATFTSEASYDDDMAQLNKNLTSMRVNYRVFSSDVPLRGAKWGAQ